MKIFNARFSAWALLLSLLGSPFTPVLPAQTNVAVSLAEALDTVATLSWSGVGSPSWLGQTLVSHDGLDAAESEVIGDNSSAGMLTTVTGPGALTYWWKVSSQTNADRLYLLLDGVGYTSISGEVDWQQRSVTVSAGVHELRWAYGKNSTISEGQDRGWVDQVQFLPATNACSFVLSPEFAHYNAGAPTSTGTVSVTTADGCEWTAFASQSWLTVLSSPSNSGPGTVVYAAAANTNLSARLGIIWIAGQRFTVGQDGFACEYTLTPTNRPHGFGASTNVVTVTSAPNCTWTVFTTNSWISILSSGTGAGNGTVTYSVATNHSTASRNGVIVIGGRLFTLTQSGAPAPPLPCTYSLSPTSRTYWGFETNDVVNVTIPTGENCAWTASTTNAWITILSSPVGTSSGSVAYALAANPSQQWRNGYIVIGGQTLSITQRSDPAIVAGPTSQRVPPGGTVVFGVAAVGTAPLTYQWLFNDTPLADGDGISGSSASNLTLAGVQESQAGNYGVIVSNSSGAASSGGAMLTVSCGFSLFPNSASATALGSTDFINVTAATNCLWMVVNTNSWVTILSSATNFGNGTVIYSVAANPTTNFRSCKIYVANLTFNINQTGSAPTNATVSLVEALDTVGELPWGTTGSPVWFGQTSVSHDGVDAAQSGAVGASGAVTVQTTVNGPGTISFWWKVSSVTNNHYLKFFINGIQQLRISGEVDWQLRSLPITSPTNILKWTYSKNGTGSAGLDKGWLDQVRFIPGTGCVVTLSPANAAHSFNAETGQVNVAAAEGCTWAVDNTNSWITPGVQIGEGNGDFHYTVTANNSPASRTGVITIGRQPFTVVQAANPAACTYALWPTSRAHASGAGSGNIILTTQVGCSWSVVNTNPWISISSTLSNAGGGTVTYHIGANTNAQARSGFISMALNHFLVTQAGGALPGTNVPPLPQFADFDVGRDFSTENNPNGVWTFGWAGTVTGAVHPLTVRRDSPADEGYIPSWQFTYDEAPVVYCNTNTETITVGGGIAALAPREVLFDGGQDGRPENFVVIRFTAPSNGLYSVATAVRPFYNGSPQGDADFHVVKNSTELFVQFLNPFQSAYYSNTLTLNAGDTIKFLLGRGADGHEYGSIFRIAALINSGTGSTTNPPPACTYTLLPTSRSHTYLQGAAEFIVTAPEGCAWNLFNSNVWVTIHSNLNTSGSDRIIYTVSENTNSLARSGNIRVGNQLFSISQDAAPLPLAEAIDIVGAPIRVWHNGYPGWAGQTNVTHDGLDAALSSGGSFTLVVTGAGTLTFWWKISSPTNSNLRLFVAGSEQTRITGEVGWQQQTLNIPAGVQALEWYFDKNAASPTDRAWVDQVQFVPVAGCTVTISPGSATHSSVSSTGLVNVAAASGCAWTVFNTNAWISIAVGSNGSGNGLVRYIVTANPTALVRSGNVQIADKIFLVTQSGAGCTISILPGSRTHGYGAATGMVNVTTQAGCTWTVVETNSWISILSSLNNSNSGTVLYSLAPNANTNARTGNIIIGGQQFRVTQLGSSLPGTNVARLEFMARTPTNAVLSVQGEAGKMYVVECSEDLIQWIPISTNSAPSTVTDAAVGNAPQRFYRTVEIP